MDQQERERERIALSYIPSLVSRNTKSSQTTLSPLGIQQDAQGRELFCHVKCEAQEFEAVTMNPGPGNWETGSR